MKPRGNQIALEPLPSPDRPCKALWNEAVREVKAGCRPDKLLRRFRARNQVTDPHWEYERISFFIERLMNSEKWAYLHDLWKDSRPQKREMTEAEHLLAEMERDAARKQRQQIMSALGCGSRQAWYIQKSGTPRLQEAQLLAKHIEGTAVDDWIFTISARGKNPSRIAEAITSRNMLGCSVHDYVLARPSRRLKPNDTADWLNNAYKTNQLKKRHFAYYKELGQIVPARISDGEKFWSDYKLWRTEKIIHDLEADLLNPLT